MATISGYHHVAMRVNDFDASVRFYTGTLGFTPGRSWSSGASRAIMLEAGNGSYLELFERTTPAAPPTGEAPLLHFALRTTDCAELLEKVRTTGAEITVETKDVDIPSVPVFPVRIAFFKGPDGEIVELFEER